ncbi:hypothetical protein [Photobacterium kishitanii]|uniref:Uncharacterized protein n=1 Tax=Photobacterium kishitanii TaxID=318456 RepID=A0A2T3KKZ6_9GAMM|nr:hypothetical protein [Photobacterium kishitanii]PSV00329.1 hypothetical protein C9J27_04175 [Photobacterium kishitanii]
MADTSYIACANFEETICYFGEGASPDKALDNFLSSGNFAEFCENEEIKNTTSVEIKIFKAIHAGDLDADDDLFEDGWGWVLGEEISSHQEMYLKKN